MLCDILCENQRRMRELNPGKQSQEIVLPRHKRQIMRFSRHTNDMPVVVQVIPAYISTVLT